MARVLYLSYDGMTDPIGQSQILPYLSGLAAKGHEITIVSFEKRKRKYRKSSIRIQLAKDGISWHPFHFTQNPPLLSTLWDLFKLYRRVAYLCKKSKFDFIHCRNYPVALVALSMKRRKSLPFLMDVRRLWIDEQVERGNWHLNNPLYRLIYRFFRNKEKAFFQKATAVVCLTDVGKKVLRERFNCQLPIHVIPCSVDTQLFDKKNIHQDRQKSYRKTLGLPEDRLVISYLGSIGTWYLLPEMMHFFSRLLLVHPKAIFLFITREKMDKIYKVADQYEIPQKRLIIIRAERDEVPVLLSFSNFSICFLKPTFSKQASSPTKQGEIMSLGIPMVCNKGVGDTGEIVEKYSAGIMVEGFSEKAYDKVIQQLDKVLKLKPEKIREGALKFYSLEKGVEKYHQVYEMIHPSSSSDEVI